MVFGSNFFFFFFFFFFFSWSNTGLIGAESGGRIILNDTWSNSGTIADSGSNAISPVLVPILDRSAGREARFTWKGR